MVNPVTMAVISQDGAVLTVSEPLGTEIGQAIREADRKRHAEQRRHGVTSGRHVGRVDDALHHLANRIVAEARSYGAQTIIENLNGLK